MPPTRKPRSAFFDVKPSTTVRQLAASTIFDALDGPELVVYLRLCAAESDTTTWNNGRATRVVKMQNLELHRNRGGRTAATALRRLAELGLVKVKHGRGPFDRTITVLG